MSLAAALEEAAGALAADADAIRPANGDPTRLLESLDGAAAQRVLGWLLAERPEAAAELAATWAEQPEGVAHLLAVEADALPRDGRKALRRLQHRLRSSGVAVPRAAPQPVVASLPALDESLGGAYVSGLDPSGARLAFWLDSAPTGVWLYELILDEVRGVLRCDLFQATRKQARKFMRDAERRDELSLVPIPVEALHALCARIAAVHPEDRPPPRAFREARSRLTGEGDAPGALVRAALGGEADPARLEQVAKMIRDRELGPWPPAPDALREEAERLRDAGGSKLIVSEGTQRERAEGRLTEAAGRLFDGEAGIQTAHRFAEMAYVLWRREREDDARACLAAAAAFEAGDPAANPVALAMLEVVLEPVLASLAEEEKDSLLVKP